MITRLLRFTVCVAVVSACAGHASAVVLFSDNFNIDTSGSWTKNAAPVANASTQLAEFAFDYSTFGIPAAPGAADTLGLRLRANVPPDTTRPPGVTSGLSVSPTGLALPTNYQMTVYAWSNFFGSANASGLADNGNSQGGTNNVMFALGTSGMVPLVVGNTGLVVDGQMDGVGFATTGDGGITNDFRVYPKSGTIAPTTTLAAGSYLNTNAYYTSLFPAVAAPEVQKAISTAEFNDGVNNTQAGLTQAGAFGFAWHKVVIAKVNNIVTWRIDNALIGSQDASALTLGGNIALGESDVNSTTARHPSLVFTVFDNLSVTDVQSGDFNLDGRVDAADYTLWKDNLGAVSEAPISGNGDALNGVDQNDFTLWLSHFTTPGSGGGGVAGTSVPEPTSLLLLLIGAGCCLRRRRRS